MNPPCSWEQEISVVFPLVDGRMGGLESVRSWTKRQTLPRDRFQVIAVSDGSDSEYEKRVADLLAPHDRLIRHSTDNFLELYDVGLRHATGRLIVLTEHYCVADPDCLSAVAEYFRENDSDGACLHIDWVCLNEVARLKWNERNQERLSYFDADEHWNKFLFAGFAAYRETFRAIGGLEFRYGLFLEVSVGAQFHDHGIRLGSIPNARVQHLDDNTFKKVLDFIRNFTEGEIRFLAERDASFCRRYFGSIPEWESRLTDEPARRWKNGWLLGRVLWEEARQVRFRGFRGLALECARQLVRASVPAALRARAARLGVSTACGRFYLWRWSQERRVRALNDACDRMVRYVRMKSVLRYRDVVRPSPIAIHAESATRRRDTERFDDEQATGLYAGERAGDTTYRWTEPVATLPWNVPARDYVLTIETLGLRGRPSEYLVACYWNGKRVLPANLTFTDHSVRLRIPRDTCAETERQELVIVCRPLRPKRTSAVDRRRLGMPIVAIDLRESHLGRPTTTKGRRHESQAA